MPAITIVVICVFAGLGFIWYAFRRVRILQVLGTRREAGLAPHGVPSVHLGERRESLVRPRHRGLAHPTREADKLISRGGFGKVYGGSYHNQRVAIKTLLPASRKNLKCINAFLGEAKIMGSIEHERVVSFVGVAWDSLRNLCMVTEFMNGGDLRSLLMRFHKEESRPLGFDCDKLRIAKHVAHALTYLHSLSSPVVHRDLKSRNILLTSQLDVKLTDFGISRELGDQSYMTTGWARRSG